MDDKKYCPEGPGGDQMLVNNDEQEILDRTTQGLAVEIVGYQPEDLH